MLGTIIGDIIGSAYEFHNCRRTDFEPLFHPKARFTDDTVCTIAVADALTRGIEPQAVLIDWCQRYAENGGWGKRFALWFMGDNPQPYGSWGNGAAMRISPVGFLANAEEEAIAWADHVTNLTHSHPDAIASAQAVALAIYWAKRKVSAADITTRLTERYGYNLAQTPDDIRPTYKRTESAAGSVPQALVCALQSTSFEHAIRTAVSIGGDSDTIAAIAGGIAEAMYGVPDPIAQSAWAYLPADMQGVVRDFYTEVHASHTT
jgi:ADP-ribosyl-[dinitrogen reductase] hydrolase